MLKKAYTYQSCTKTKNSLPSLSLDTSDPSSLLFTLTNSLPSLKLYTTKNCSFNCVKIRHFVLSPKCVKLKRLWSLDDGCANIFVIFRMFFFKLQKIFWWCLVAVDRFFVSVTLLFRWFLISYHNNCCPHKQGNILHFASCIFLISRLNFLLSFCYPL